MPNEWEENIQNGMPLEKRKEVLEKISKEAFEVDKLVDEMIQNYPEQRPSIEIVVHVFMVGNCLKKLLYQKRLFLVLPKNFSGTMLRSSNQA